MGTLAYTSEAAKNDDRLKALARRFGMLHAGSSIASLTGLCCGVFHMWYLARLVAERA